MIAKDGGRPLTAAEIAARGGLSRASVILISKMETFENMSAKTIDRFVYGCGFDPIRTKRARFLLWRIFNSKQGISGARHLHVSKRLSKQERSCRLARLRNIKAILTNGRNKVRSGSDQ